MALGPRVFRTRLRNWLFDCRSRGIDLMTSLRGLFQSNTRWLASRVFFYAVDHDLAIKNVAQRMEKVLEEGKGETRTAKRA
jgi:hypothetical protein